MLMAMSVPEESSPFSQTHLFVIVLFEGHVETSRKLNLHCDGRNSDMLNTAGSGSQASCFDCTQVLNRLLSMLLDPRALN